MHKENVMELTAENKLRKLIIVGDRVLIKIKKSSEKTTSGLYLPPGVQEKEKVQQGYIIRQGKAILSQWLWKMMNLGRKKMRM